MNTTMLIKTDKVLKQKVQKLAKEMGLPVGTLVNNYFKHFVLERQVVFDALIPNKKTIQAILQAEKEFARGEYEGPFTIEELRKKWKLV